MNFLASTALNDRGFSYIFPKFSEIPIQAPKPLNPSHFLTQNKTLLFHFVGSFIPHQMFLRVLNSFHHSLNTSLPISHHKTSEGFLKVLLASQSTLNCHLNFCVLLNFLCASFCHLVLIWAYCDGRVDFIDWAGGDIGSGMLSRVGDGLE
jgi:hypothetical protein